MFYLCSANKINHIDIEVIFSEKWRNCWLLEEVTCRNSISELTPPSAPARGSRSSRQSNFKSVDEEQQGKMDVLENEEV